MRMQDAKDLHTSMGWNLVVDWSLEYSAKISKVGKSPARCMRKVKLCEGNLVYKEKVFFKLKN